MMILRAEKPLASSLGDRINCAIGYWHIHGCRPGSAQSGPPQGVGHRAPAAGAVAAAAPGLRRPGRLLTLLPRLSLTLALLARLLPLLPLLARSTLLLLAALLTPVRPLA